MNAIAVILERPEHLKLGAVDIAPAGEADVVVDIAFSGISTGTERLLWSGRMPSFPGMGYPLVPGYESVGRVREAGAVSGHRVGDTVFVPGARCFGDIRGLFGGAASQVMLPGERAVAIPAALGETGVLFALAATAHHAVAAPGAVLPDLIVGHGVLGRLLARITVALGGDPVVWETNPERRDGARGYRVIDPLDDARHDYRAIYDVSGAPDLLDTLIGRLAKGGEVVLAGFYDTQLTFSFPPAFLREARVRASAEWKAPDIAAVQRLLAEGRLALDGLITHRHPAAEAATAYRTAFNDAACLKMVLDWRNAR